MRRTVILISLIRIFRLSETMGKRRAKKEKRAVEAQGKPKPLTKKEREERRKKRKLEKLEKA